MLSFVTDLFRSHSMPSSEEIRLNSAIPIHTPDLWKLEQAPKALIFEYSEYMFGMPKQRKLIGEYPVATAYTRERFTLWKRDHGCHSFGIALNSKASQHKKTVIQGHVFAVDPKVVQFLDNHRENGLSFVRRRVPLTLVTGGDVQAWMYIAKRDFWEPKIIDWDQTYYRSRGGLDYKLTQLFTDPRDWNKQYYRFTEHDVKGNSR